MLKPFHISDNDGFFRHDDVLQGGAVPPSDRGFVGMQFVPDLLPGHVVDIAVAKNHLFVLVADCIDDTAHLLLQRDEPVDLLVWQVRSPVSRLSRNEILLQNRAGKGMPYVMAILDDIVTGVTPVPAQPPEEPAEPADT